MDSLSGPDPVTHHHLSKQEVRQHAGPWLIAIGVACKSFLALATALGLEIWGTRRMHDWVGIQIERHHLNPEHGFFAELMRQTSHGPGTVHLVAAVLVAYASVHGAEAWGLWRDKPWASWLGCIGAALYLPVDVTALVSNPGWITASVVAINVIVVVVLGWNIRNLRRHRAVGG
ncbi:MAG TPA: DUF2127 domain-containing protein [Xanthomonadaceae bacterium]|nr:DUF2127 domain-containing protein [Xanthomonadaceae bacterium]